MTITHTQRAHMETDGVEREALDVLKHRRFARDMNEALRDIRRAEFIRNRPPADLYVLTEYKWGFK